MREGFLFFCCSCCILVLTIINLSVGPIVSGKVGDDQGLLNCEQFKDQKDNIKDAVGGTLPDEEDKYLQSHINYCTRVKGMYNMEYIAFIFDIVIGFICSLIGLLHLFDIKKDFVSKTGLIGLICGIVGLVLTFVYAIFNVIVFTSKCSSVVERDEDGVFAIQSSGTTYKCLFYDGEDFFGGHAEFFELNQKQYNYKHNFYDSAAKKCEDINGKEAYFCKGNVDSNGETFTASTPNIVNNNCKFIYAKAEVEITNKDKFDRFVTTLLLCWVVLLANIGLAIFGFLLFRTPGDF